MERLTYDGNFCDIAQCLEIPGGSYCEDGACSQKKVWERLKAYEDTGMSPQACEGVMLLETVLSGADYSVSRMVELMCADKDGRLVVLPVKEGDTVHFAAWFGTEPHIVKRVTEPYFYTADVRDRRSTAEFSLGFFGKTVFSTREEAEQALERSRDNE